jgi:hypothetical protein
MYVIIGCLILSTTFQLNARNNMQGIQNIRNHLNQATKESGLSLKELLAQQKNQSILSGKVIDTPTQIIAGNNAILVRSLNKNEIKQQYDLAMQKLESLYWCKQSSLIQQLKLLEAQNHTDALMLLTQNILARYMDQKIPLISFAQDLEHENQVLQSLDTALKNHEIPSDITTKDNLDQQITNIHQQVVHHLNNLEMFMYTVNNMLLVMYAQKKP